LKNLTTGSLPDEKVGFLGFVEEKSVFLWMRRRLLRIYKALMKKLIVLIIAVLFMNCLTGQDSWNSPIYYDVDRMMKDIIINKENSKYFDEIDFESVLLLDTSYFKQVLEFESDKYARSQLINIYNNTGKKEYHDTIPTIIKNIKELFQYQNRNILIDFFKSHGRRNYELHHEVYLKEPNKVIISISDDEGNENWLLQLKDGYILPEITLIIIGDTFRIPK
jgi:hypothetical protein